MTAAEYSMVGVLAAFSTALLAWFLCSAAACSQAMESLCHVLWLKWQFADLPAFCFTSISDHFIEGTQITHKPHGFPHILTNSSSLFC